MTSDKPSISGLCVSVLVIVIGFMMGLCVVCVDVVENKPDKSIEITNEYDRGYRTGVSNALDCMMLLSLEQQLYNTNRTWGDMSSIVKSRLGVK